MTDIFNFDEKLPFAVTNKIRLIELFAGYGSQAMALKRLGADFEHYRMCEFDKYAVKSYNTVHGTSFEVSDIRTWKGSDLGITDTDRYTYMMTYSFPCLTEDSLILTKDGYKELKDVNVGDIVLTKSNTWHKVAKKFDNGIHDTCYVNSYGFKNLHCTLNHKFYVRELYRKYPKYENGKRGNERHFKSPVFKEVKDITKKDYFGIPIIQEELPYHTSDLDFWYMLGFYVGDGYLSVTGHNIRLCCNDKKLKKLESHLDIKKWKYTITDTESSCHKLRFANEEIYSFIRTHIGTGSENKKIPRFILTLPEAQLESFFNGYMDSDGSVSRYGKNDYVRISSVNENLIYSMASIIHKLYKRPVSINVDKPRKKPHFINGRKINNNHPLYELKFKYSTSKWDRAFCEDGYVWYPFYGIEPAEKEHVYNLEIEEDHSYIVNGCVSKNCTDLSVAGQMKGMSKDTGTRSALIWEVERLLDETEELPQILFMENVPQVHSRKNFNDFNMWMKFLESKGYSNFYRDLNAKDYGVAQSRNRCFMVSLLGDYEYDFPLPIPLNKIMKDYLDKDVDEKYFINNEKSQKLINDLIEKGVIPRDGKGFEL